MVKFLPNKDYFEIDGTINPRLDPIGFAESNYQLKQYLKRCIIATVDRNQKPNDLEKALKAIKISIPDLLGPPILGKRTAFSLHLY
ncbi:MAG: hypothetical protein QW063_02155 [Candidatus Nanoarchaeia archaeon]